MDIEGTRIPRCKGRRREILQICRFFDCGISSVIYSIINKGTMLLGRHKKRAVVVFYFVLEGISFTLDQLEKKRWSFLLIAFLLSAFVSIAVTYAHVTDRTTKSQAERQLGVLEVSFAILQLVPISINFTVGVLGININYNIPCVFPLALAMVAVVFVFRRDENLGYHHLPYHRNDISSSNEDVLMVSGEPRNSDFMSNSSIDIDRTETLMSSVEVPLLRRDIAPDETPIDFDLTETTAMPLPLHNGSVPVISIVPDVDQNMTTATSVDRPLPCSDSVSITSTSTEEDLSEIMAAPSYDSPLLSDYYELSEIMAGPSYDSPLLSDYYEPTRNPTEVDLDHESMMVPPAWRDNNLRSRYPKKASSQASRLTWTTKVQARFVHAVEQLGGHERARPKSVHRDLMDIKGLTLDQVRRRLQKHKKTYNKAASSSGRSR